MQEIYRNLVRSACVVIVMGLSLSGCISSTTGGFTEKADPNKALEHRVSLARKYIGEGNWEHAKRNLREANEIDPKNPEVHEAFALVYQSTGEYELAEEHFKTAIRLDKQFSRARNNYAAFLYAQGRYKEAEEQLEHVVRDTLYEARPRAFINLGLCRQQLFDREGAEEAFRRALAMERRNSIALLELAHLRFEADDYLSANQYYDGYRSVVRQQSARGLWLGVRLARKAGDLNAEGSYSLALRNLFPDSPEYQALKRTDQSDS